MNAQPPASYINTTIDGDCVVQCGRKAIWDIYENFTKYMLWNQDNVLVDFHLTTFNGSSDQQHTLIIKVKNKYNEYWRIPVADPGGEEAMPPGPVKN